MDLQQFSWTELYPFIRGANIAIIKLAENEAGLEAELLTRLTGEAHFMRAVFYSQLMRQFGGVVLTDTPFTLDDEANNPRASFEATVNFIVADLDAAITLLANAPVSKSRAHKTTALALKSRVLTHAASDLYDAAKSSSISLLSGYSNPELIRYTTGNQNARYELAKQLRWIF